MKEKVVLAYSGGLDTTAIIPWLKEHFDYEVAASTADRETSLTAWKSGQNSPALPNYTLKTSSTNSVTTTSCPVYRQAPYTKTNTS